MKYLSETNVFSDHHTKTTLEKHVKGKHEDNSFSETISSFINRFEIGYLSKRCREKLKRHVLNRKEAIHMEKIIQMHGAYYI